MKRKKIAIYHNLPGGGSVRVIDKLASHLSLKNSVDIYSIRENNNNWSDKILNYKETVKRVKPWPGFILRNLWIATTLPFIHKKLAETINGKGYDLLIITHDIFTKSPYILRYLTGKTIYILHEPQREFYEPSIYHANGLKQKVANILRTYIKYIDHHNVRHADTIIVNSRYSRKVIEKIYNCPTKLLYPGVDTNIFKPGISKKENKIISIGALGKIKGHDFVISSLDELLGKYSLTIIGDGTSKDIQNLLKINKSKNKFINIVKHTSDDDLIRYLNESKLLCIGSYREPFGLTSIEAQATGVPVVSVNEGGVPETIINGKTGFSVSRNTLKFNSAVKKTLKNYRELGTMARKNAIKNWSWKKYFDYFDEELNKIK